MKLKYNNSLSQQKWQTQQQHSLAASSTYKPANSKENNHSININGFWLLQLFVLV